MIEILDVIMFRKTEEHLRGLSIDQPRLGRTGDGYALDIAGWIVGRSSPVVAVEVIIGATAGAAEELRFQILYRGRSIHRAPLNLQRLDIARRYGLPDAEANCGFALTIGVLGLPPVADLLLEAVCADGNRVLIGAIRVRHGPLASDFQPTLQPLMVTGLGRSGTTWIMKVLSQHPAIVVERTHPFETRAAAYWIHLLKVLASPADHRASAHPEGFLDNLWWAGFNPFNALPATNDPAMKAWFQQTYCEQVAGFCQRMIESFYQKVAAKQGQTAPRYFAEKYYPHRTGHAQWLAWDLYPQAREIILVRDFRDTICSMLAFNAKRGHQAFGRNFVQTDEQFVWLMRLEALRLLHIWRSRADRTLLVRYEDLITSPAATLAGICTYLEIDARSTLIDDLLGRASTDSSALAFHRTSRNVGATIGRWKQDLKPGVREACQKAFGDILQAFDYALDN